MRTLCVENHQPAIKIAQLPTRSSERQILIKVHSMGLNRADLLQIEGRYSSPNGSNVLGLELSGTREDNGDTVCVLVDSGAFAEYIYVYPEQLLPVPKGVDLATAASLPEVLITCWLNLFKLGNIASGESVLIHGGSSGVGSFAVQLAKAYGCKVFTTIGDNEKRKFCVDLGADATFNYRVDDYVKLIKEQGGVDFILDILGGEYFEKNISCLKKGGRLVLIAVMAGSEIRTNAASILMKNLKIYGSTLRSKALEEKAMLISSAVKNLYQFLERKVVQLKIDSIYKFEEYALAFDRMRSRKHTGKIIITFND